MQTASEIGTDSTATTVLPIPPVNVEIVPNPDIIGITTPIVEILTRKAQLAADLVAFLGG